MLNKNLNDIDMKNIGIRILVISIESSNTSTEQMYFKNGLRLDRKFLNRLNIDKLTFWGWNFNFFNNNGWKKALEELFEEKHETSKIFIICDRDSKSYDINKNGTNLIEKSIKKIKKAVDNIFRKNHTKKKPLIEYLNYNKTGQTFEDFLRMHFESKKIYDGYKKGDMKIYEKVMGWDGKNYSILKFNLLKDETCKKFINLFEGHERIQEEFD